MSLKLRVLLAAVVAAPAVALAFMMRGLSWAPRLDFDVVGFVWLITNLPLLILWLILAVLSAIAIYAWVRLFRAPP